MPKTNRHDNVQGPGHNAAIYSLSDREYALQLIRTGQSIYTASKTIGCDPTTVWRWVRQYNAVHEDQISFSAKRYPEVVKQEVLLKLEAGKSQNAVARDTGLTQQTISQWYRKAKA